MDILGIAYLGFESPNAKAWLDFGPEVMGFGLAEPAGNDDTVYLRMDERTWRIAVHPGETDRLAYIGWECQSRVAWLEGIAKLEAADIEVTIGDLELNESRRVHGVAQFTDPIGYRHELVYGQEFHTHSFQPGRPGCEFVAGRAGVGHIVLIAPAIDHDALDHFMRGVMGFTWFGHGSVRGPGGFYRSKLNPHSHNIAYQMAPGHMGVHHIGIEVAELDDVGIAYDRHTERELPLIMTLGRHTQDPVVSFYGVTPSGFGYEYLWDGGSWTDEELEEVRPQHLSLWGHKLVGSMLPPSVRPVEQPA